MSSFYSGDIAIFEQDHAIIGEIDTTWSDFETEPSYEDEDVYIHTSTPASVRMAWCGRLRISPGYVVARFLLPHDGFCLVAERFLRLRDRPLMVGEIVKRKRSDVQSGRVLSSVSGLNRRLPYTVHSRKYSAFEETSSSVSTWRLDSQSYLCTSVDHF